MLSRRQFVSSAAVAAAVSAAQMSGAEKNQISLAAWSINRSFFQTKRWTNLELPALVRKEFGITGIEYVNQFFGNPTMRYLQQLKRNCENEGVTSVLIMIDHEGDMANASKEVRMQAAVAHRKWVDVAHYLGCHAIRCNLGGPRKNFRQDTGLVSRAAESFTDLLEYAEDSGVKVLIENHGGASSEPDVLLALMKKVNHPRFGVLPDYGNMNPGGDHRKNVKMLMPYAKAMSVKAGWTLDEKHPGYDLEQIIKDCKEYGYTGWWGIESSYGRVPRGTPQPKDADAIWANEKKGVMLTKAVLDRIVVA
jgi:sugar phosphate isomerase/epimerase